MGLIMQELRKLGLGREALLGDEEDLVLDPRDPVEAVKLRFLPTGNYLRPCDMEYCVENTNFSEEEIIQWFKSFRYKHVPNPISKVTFSKVSSYPFTVRFHPNICFTKLL
jgi:hypothetical protein